MAHHDVEYTLNSEKVVLMTNITLHMAMDLNPRTWALLEGDVSVEGVDLVVHSDLRGPRLFRHQMRTREFDICDMSLTSVYMMHDRNDTRFVPLPVFTMRHFFHTTALVRRDAGIANPSDLKEKRVGIPGYQSAASLWCRGALQHEFGVSPLEVNWFTEQSADAASGEVAFEPPIELRLTTIPPTTTIEEMLLAGELDAFVNVTRPSAGLLSEGSGVQRLFEDPRAEGIRYYQKTGIYPTNHCVIIERDVIDKHPFVAPAVFKAFLESNRRAAVSPDILQPYIETGLLEPNVRDALATELFGYGIESQLLVLDTFSQYCNEQGYTARTLTPNEVFSFAEWDEL